MDAVMPILVLLLAAGVAWAVRTAWRLYRYPGGWGDAFGPAHEAERRRLDDRRKEVRSLRSTAAQELMAAQNGVNEADQAYARRISELEQTWQRLQEEAGRGDQRAEPLGAMWLYEHVVVFKGKDVPLKGLSVEVRRGESHYYLYLIFPKGYKDYETFAYAEYTEDQVHRFELAIHNAIMKEEDVRADRAASVRTIEAELAAARADTGPQQAGQHLAKVRNRQKNDEKLSLALAKLKEALDHWEQRTGRRPPT
ncbi:hypothetical protein [Streptomyces sp. DH10]|uniref:hypothetical protein n=1 Tax=Streptomyces sp. DH10 TaxID=3040121 RepID=UPI002442F1BC|nr:hypothetical protein [Streptomyces sp. DH10]MDG9709480.1 hypothetical protein [Streptomyces sp. DH10]